MGPAADALTAPRFTAHTVVTRAVQGQRDQYHANSATLRLLSYVKQTNLMACDMALALVSFASLLEKIQVSAVRGCSSYTSQAPTASVISGGMQQVYTSSHVSQTSALELWKLPGGGESADRKRGYRYNNPSMALGLLIKNTFMMMPLCVACCGCKHSQHPHRENPTPAVLLERKQMTPQCLSFC